MTKVAPNAMEPVWYFQKAKLANEVKINQTKNLKLSFKKRARFLFFFFYLRNQLHLATVLNCTHFVLVKDIAIFCLKFFFI